MENIPEIDYRDKNAFAKLVSEYQEKIFRFVYGLTGKYEDSKDLVQEIFVKAYLNIDKFDNTRKMDPWLYAIARNHVWSHLKSQKNIVKIALEKVQDFLGRNDESEGDEIADEELAEALKSLKKDEKEIVSLRFNSDLKLEEIGEIMKMPLSTIKTKLRRSLEKLKSLLDKNNE